MDDFLKTNRELWDKLATIHHSSKFYDVEGFLGGKQTLDPVEIEELPNLAGKRLVHLMCHFGLDTLSLARLGARVTGVDFSSKAIDLARSLAKTTGIESTFVCSDVYDAPKHLDGEFDVVFTSGGVLTWLPDLERWASVISTLLKPGGFFYIREFHPFASIFDDEEDTELNVKYPYFQGREPLMFESEGSYACGDAKTGLMKAYEWNHPISRIINSLIEEGLRIQYLNEFPFTSYKALPFMVENEKGRWILPSFADSVPLMFSLKATKPL
ncbi:MAG: class I SAM-dependent methyltransferase [Candidatus Thorarchaeota archaeon]